MHRLPTSTNGLRVFGWLVVAALVTSCGESLAEIENLGDGRIEDVEICDLLTESDGDLGVRGELTSMRPGNITLSCSWSDDEGPLAAMVVRDLAEYEEIFGPVVDEDGDLIETGSMESIEIDGYDSVQWQPDTPGDRLATFEGVSGPYLVFVSHQRLALSPEVGEALYRRLVEATRRTIPPES